LDGLVRGTALLLTMLTGFSGLVYEVAWQKYLATLLGSHSEATAAVLALFLGGLSVGYSLFGAVTRRVVQRGEARGEAPRLLFLYGVIEAGIGVSALLFPWLYQAVRALSLAIPHEAGGAGFALDVGLSALLVLPPAILMGGTIPILTQALSRSLADATRLHAHVYAFNTAGAFVGALAAAFVLIPWLGLTRVVLAMGVVNLFAGGIFIAFGWRRRPLGAIQPATDDPNAPVPALGLYAAVALLAGFAAMVFQTVLIRVAGLSLGSSNFTFSMVVAVFVLCIALGSFAVSALTRIPGWLIAATQWTLALLMLSLYPRLNEAPFWAHLVRSWFRDVDAAFYPFYATVFACMLAVLVVPIGLSGATLPLIFHHRKRLVGDLGAAAGRLYSWNTVGSLLGALLGGYVLFFWLDLDQVYQVALAAVVVAASLLTVQVFGLPRPLAVLMLAPALVAVTSLPRWEPGPFASAAFRFRAPRPDDGAGPRAFFDAILARTRVVFYDDDPNSSVAVRESLGPTGPDPAIVTNGKPDGSIGVDYPTMALAALIPAVFAERAETGFVIGYGTGVTVGELAALRSMQSVTVAEISPGVIRAAPHFEAHNQRALTNGKTQVVVSDAYRALLRSGRDYDVIASEPSNPWVSGVEMLFSQEFLSAAKDRLRPGGVYAQWFHCYENDPAVIELVLRTYASVFDQVAVWFALGPDILLLGFKNPELPRLLDLGRLQRRFTQPDFRAGFGRSGIASLPALLVHELLPVGVVNAAQMTGDVHTILHPVLSHRAGRAFFRGQEAQLPPFAEPASAKIGAERSLLRRYAAALGGALDDETHAIITAEGCKTRPILCASLLAYWHAQIPESPARDAQHAALLQIGPFRRHVGPAMIATLASFYAAAPATDPIPPAEATRLTDLFAEYYFHGAPYPRSTLASFWTRCRGAGATGGCDAARAHAERRVGPLPRGIEKADASPSR
jgi:predicted membrane-bound spermidine synthase